MKPAKPLRFLQPLRVRRVEVDIQGSVAGSHYLAWFDSALAGYWRAMALPYRQTMARLQGELRVSKATLIWHGAAREDDALQIGLRCAQVAESFIGLQAACLRGPELLVEADLDYVFFDSATHAGAPLPQVLRDALRAFESAEPMTQVRVGRWDELCDDARPIRTKVFVQEQQIPAEMEWDAADADCTHAVAYNRLDMPLATGRLLEHVPGTAKIGRMAVLPEVRGSGVGRAVLDALMDAARARGDREVLLYAQLSAAPFYLRAGFQPRGPEFDEAGIAHVEMVRGL